VFLLHILPVVFFEDRKKKFPDLQAAFGHQCFFSGLDDFNSVPVLIFRTTDPIGMVKVKSRPLCRSSGPLCRSGPVRRNILSLLILVQCREIPYTFKKNISTLSTFPPVGPRLILILSKATMHFRPFRRAQ